MKPPLFYLKEKNRVIYLFFWYSPLFGMRQKTAKNQWNFIVMNFNQIKASFLFNKIKYMNITVFFCITSRFRLSQIIPHSDFLNIMPKIGLQKGRGRHQKINFFKHCSSFNYKEIFSFLNSSVSKILAICLIFRLKM